MNKTLLRVLCLVLMVASLLAFTLAFTPSRTYSKTGSGLAGSAPALSGQQPTPTPEERLSHPGSTDGITIMSIVIAVIILAPLLVQRSLWRRAEK